MPIETTEARRLCHQSCDNPACAESCLAFDVQEGMRPIKTTIRSLQVRALFGDDMTVTDTRRNKLLRTARHLRALRSWITKGAYAWYRLTDDLKSVQREMVKEWRA